MQLDEVKQLVQGEIVAEAALQGKEWELTPEVLTQKVAARTPWRFYKFQVDPHETMSLESLLHWLKAGTEEEALAIWRSDFVGRHPELATEEDWFFQSVYALDPAIANFWLTAPGKLIKRLIQSGLTSASIRGLIEVNALAAAIRQMIEAGIDVALHERSSIPVLYPWTKPLHSQPTAVTPVAAAPSSPATAATQAAQSDEGAEVIEFELAG